MKQQFLKQVLTVALLVCAVPATLLAQDEKAKEKTKAKKQQIVITRTGDENGKTVIEIDGDKVKINGKDAADLKDVNVHINNLRGSGAYVLGQNGARDFNFNFDLDQPSSIWKVDSNRAMLGVVTDGDDKGAEIQSITKESAAEKAGLKKGDIITKIDNKKIETTDEVTEAIRAHKPGEKVTITYLRDDKEYKATAELGRWKGVNMRTMVAPKVMMAPNVWNENLNSKTFERLQGMEDMHVNGFAIAGNRPKLGLSVQDTDDGKGVKVLDVDDEGTAAKAGVKEGDIITQVDDKAVNGADDISKLMREKKDQPSIKLQINRSGKTQTIDVKIPKKLKTVDM